MGSGLATALLADISVASTQARLTARGVLIGPVMRWPQTPVSAGRSRVCGLGRSGLADKYIASVACIALATWPPEPLPESLGHGRRPNVDLVIGELVNQISHNLRTETHTVET